MGCRARSDDADRRSVHDARLPRAAVGSDRARRSSSSPPAIAATPAPYRVRSVKSTDARIPGDQFFTDERKAVLTAIDVASGTPTALTTGAGRSLRSFRVSPTGTHLLYVAAVPETLGVIGKEQNDTFVLPIDCRRGTAAPRRPRKPHRSRRGSRGRRTASSCCSSKAGRLMALPAEGGGAAKPWRESFTLAAASRCGRLTASRFADARRRSVGHRPGARAGRRPGCARRRSRSCDVYVVGSDGIGEERDERSSTIRSPIPCGAPTATRALLPRHQQRDLRRNGISLHARRSEATEAIVRGEETCGRLRCRRHRTASSRRSRMRPTLRRSLARRRAAQRTRITDLNPQLARFAFSKPELFYLPQRRRRSARRAALQAGRPRPRTRRCRSSPGSTRR